MTIKDISEEVFGSSHFDGPDYDPELDKDRLKGQLLDIYKLMKAGKWMSLREIEDATGHPQSSISAQLRHLRKPRFGAHTVEKQRRGERKKGLFEYRIL